MSGEDTGTYTIGGAAGLDQFKFVGVIFLWNLEMGRAGTLLDGKRFVFSQFQSIIIFLTNSSDSTC